MYGQKSSAGIENYFFVKIYISEIKVEVESVVEFSKLPISEFKKNSIRFY